LLLTQTWVWEKDESVRFELNQAPLVTELNLTQRGYELIDVDGVRALRRLTDAAPPDRLNPSLRLYWLDEKYGYELTGTLAGPLTEEILLRILASVRA
jgi:hypothetical protein